jgi:hypothetical protein
MSSKMSSVWSTPFGKIIMGVIKLGLAGFLIALVNSLSDLGGDITVGDMTIPVSTIFKIIIGFFPLLLLISSMRDLGVNI